VNPLDYNGCFFVVTPWIITFFRKFSFILRVCWFEPKLFESAMDLRWFGFTDVFKQKKEVSLWSFTWFYSEIWIRIFGVPWFGSVLHWFLFEIRNWTGDTLSLLRWLKIFEILSFFFSTFLFCDRAWVRYLWWWIRAWIVGEISSMMKIHLWISESSHEFHEFWPELSSGKLGFMELFFNFFLNWLWFDLTE